MVWRVMPTGKSSLSRLLGEWIVADERQNSDWYASWGWDYNGDFTVMTVVNVPTQLEAFFGYNHPNSGLPIAHYADVGPNAVQHT